MTVNYSSLENFLNRFCAVFAVCVVMVIIHFTAFPTDTLVPISTSTYATMFKTMLFTVAGAVLLPRRVVSEINFWLLIAIFLMLPFLYSRDTKENFLLVKETTLRICLISMFAIFMFRKLSSGTFFDALSDVPWHIWAFVLFGVVSYAWTATPFATIHYSLIFISYLIFFIVSSDVLKKPWQLYSLSDILITAANIASIYGILQYYRVANTSHNYDPLFGVGEVIGNSDRKRVFSFFGNPVFLGVYLDAALPIAFAMFISALAAGSKWAHKYEKYILRSQIILITFAVTYALTFMIIAQTSVNDMILEAKKAGVPTAVEKISNEITAAGSKAFFVAPVLYIFLIAGGLWAFFNMPMWQEREKQIYRLFNGLFSFMGIFTCIFITFTRTAWIATAAALFAFAVYLFIYAHDLVYAYRKWIIGFTIAFVIATIVLTAMYFKPSSVNTGTESITNRLTSAFTVVQRIMLYDITINVIKLNPWFGHGLGSFGYFYPIHQAKFYNGEFLYIIKWMNSFCQNTIPNRSINFVIWSFDKFTTSVKSQIFGLVYFVVFLMGGMFLLIYHKKIKLLEYSAVYIIAIFFPFFYAFSRYLASGAVYLKNTANILSPDPAEYHWLSAGFAHVHNEYLQIWSDMGVFALIIFLIVFADYFYKGSWLLKRLKNSPDRTIIIGYLCAVIAMLVESIANFPFQRIMPILIANVGFVMIFHGRRIFEEGIIANITPAPAIEQAPADEPAAAVQVKPAAAKGHALKSYKEIEHDEPLFASDMIALQKNRHLSDNVPFYFVIAILFLGMNYFPARYVLGNVDLKSGHTFISQAQSYRSNAEAFNRLIREGLKFLQRSCERVPYNSEAWFWWGDTLKLVGEYDEAIKKFDTAISICHTKHSYYSRGVCYYEKYKTSGNEEFMKQALSDWKESISINPNFSQPLFHLGIYSYQMQKYDEALSYFKKAIKWDADNVYGDAHKFAGICAYNLKDFTQAVELFTGAFDRGSGNNISKPMSVALYTQGKFSESVKYFEQAIKENPNDPDLYSFLLSVYKKLKMTDKALELLNAKTGGNKDSAEYCYESGKLYESMGDFDRALIELGRGAAKEPNNIKIIEEIGKIYFDDKKDYATAIKFWEKIVAIDPGNLKNLYNLAVCHFHIGNLEKAREFWLKVKQRDANFQNVNEYLLTVERSLNIQSTDKRNNAPQRGSFFNY